MERNHRFPQRELLRYRHLPEFISGESYLLVMGSIYTRRTAAPLDYALRGKKARDGMEAFPFREDFLRDKKTDRDLYWTVTDEGNGQVSLRSLAKGSYLNLDGEGAFLSRKKQVLGFCRNGSLFRFFTEDGEGNRLFLRAATREECGSLLSFTSGKNPDRTSFALLRRAAVDLPLRPTEKPLLTVGTYADVHIDYQLQTKAPYLRKSIATVARKYRNKYDLDAIIMCGDNISDNASGETGNGAIQGFWPYARWQKVRTLLDKTLKRSFRDPTKAHRILYLTGNHDYQVGDRQPEGETYNSAYYTDLLPKGITHTLSRKMAVDRGETENLLCYQYRIGDVFFLVLNEPDYPFCPKSRFPSRGDPGHSTEQAIWLEERLAEIEKEVGNKAIVFVSSHFPFLKDCFYATYGACDPNAEAFLRMNNAMLRFPNLFYVYGHVHCEDQWVTLKHTGETMSHASPIDLSLKDNGRYNDLVSVENTERGKFHSDLILPMGYHHLFAGSLSFCGNHFYSNDGKHLPAGLTAADVPFLQVLVAKVYKDRVVLQMENFGTKKNTLNCLKNGTYKLTPLVCPLVKD